MTDKVFFWSVRFQPNGTDLPRPLTASDLPPFFENRLKVWTLVDADGVPRLLANEVHDFLSFEIIGDGQIFARGDHFEFVKSGIKATVALPLSTRDAVANRDGRANELAQARENVTITATVEGKGGPILTVQQQFGSLLFGELDDGDERVIVQRHYDAVSPDAAFFGVSSRFVAGGKHTIRTQQDGDLFTEDPTRSYYLEFYVDRYPLGTYEAGSSRMFFPNPVNLYLGCWQDDDWPNTPPAYYTGKIYDLYFDPNIHCPACPR